MTTTLPMWRAWAMNRKASSTASTGKARSGSGPAAPAAMSPITACSDGVDAVDISHQEVGQVVRVVRGVGAGGSGLGRGPDAALADLQEPAARREDGEAALDEVVGERVEDDVDAGTTGVRS